MERNHEIFLNILQCALKGQKLTGAEDITTEQWGEILSIAKAHNVLPLIFNAGFGHTNLAEDTALRSKVRQLVMLQTVKTSQFMQLYSRLKEKGVKPLVVKGLVCRNLYPQPDLRLSTDEDILVPPEQFDICRQVMENYGMSTDMTADEQQSAYEVPFRKTDGPLYVELHKSLFPPQSDAYGDWNRFFERAGERAVETDGISTLGHTDHMFYLICHAFKHFLHSGFGIRQLCDMAMYANAYGQQINWEEVHKNCCEINAQTFAATLFAIGEKYLIFDTEKACFPQYFMDKAVDETNMLADLLSAGVFGGSTMSRKHSSNMTLDAVSQDKQGRKAKKSLKNTLFPSAEKLKGRYTYLEEKPYMLPKAWAHRLINYIKESRLEQDNSALETLQIGSERIELLREYKVIK